MESDNSEQSIEQFIPISQTTERLLPEKVVATRLSTVCNQTILLPISQNFLNFFKISNCIFIFLDTTSSHGQTHSPNPISVDQQTSSRNASPYNNNTLNNTLNITNPSQNLIPVSPSQAQLLPNVDNLLDDTEPVVHSSHAWSIF